MREQQRKPLTHKKCVQSNHIILKCLFASFALLPIALTIFLAVTGKSILMLAIFSLIFVLCSAIYLVLSFKTNKKLQMGNYYIYMDTVSGKRKVENKSQNQDPNQPQNSNNIKYYLQFENNKYELPVSKKMYDSVKMNTPYYLLQLNDAKKALAAFAESEYYLDEDVQKRFKMY